VTDTAARRGPGGSIPASGQLPIRLAGLFLVAMVAWYAPWLIRSVNRDALWLSIPFLAANLLLIVSLLLSVVNNWQRSRPVERTVPAGHEPEVAVIVPTAGEAAELVERTVRSVLAQNWPRERLWIIVSDDAHAEAMASMVERVRAADPRTRISYHRPPPRGSAQRRGEAKAGNLNSAMDLVRASAANVRFVETRDADDEVGDPDFLRQCVGQFGTSARLAFVQTIKDCRVSPGDPFDNRQPHFFQGSMYGRHAANAVFPCGSGLVWRRQALDDIGGFPAWNLVEDLESGVLALKRGWRGCYLPIVGAIAQSAPEDLPNVYKQRGTWALDTMRLLSWRSLRGLSLRQRLQFWEIGAFYLQSLALVAFIAAPVIGFLFLTYPLTAGVHAYSLHFWPFAAAIELALAALNTGHPYESLWRARQMWTGLMPVFLKACVMAVISGPNRKPHYRVTRKDTRPAWYWRLVLPQSAMLILLAGSLAYGAVTADLNRFDAGSAYWTVLSAALLAGFVRKSWHGVSRRERATVGSRALALRSSSSAGERVPAGEVSE
jgi:cellulose synthase (UDP-forming)